MATSTRVTIHPRARTHTHFHDCAETCRDLWLRSCAYGTCVCTHACMYACFLKYACRPMCSIQLPIYSWMDVGVCVLEYCVHMARKQEHVYPQHACIHTRAKLNCNVRILVSMRIGRGAGESVAKHSIALNETLHAKAHVWAQTLKLGTCWRSFR